MLASRPVRKDTGAYLQKILTNLIGFFANREGRQKFPSRPSLLVLSQMFNEGTRLEPEPLARSVQSHLQVPIDMEAELYAAGALRNVLAHYAEYTLDVEKALQGTTNLVCRSADGGIDVPLATLRRLEQLGVRLLTKSG